MTVYSSNGISVQILERHDFPTSAVSSAACAQAADEIVPAVQDLVAKLVHDPRFEALVGGDVASAPSARAQQDGGPAAHAPGR